MQVNIQKTIARTLIMLMIISSVLSITLIKKAYAAPEFHVSPKDNLYDTNTTSVGYRFNITIWFNDPAAVYAWQVRLNYNATLLNCTGAWQPSWDTTYLFYGKTTVKPVPSFTAGSVLIADTLMGAGSVSASGYKKLAIIELQIVRAPVFGDLSCVLNMDNVDTYWLDEDLNEGVLIKTNGNYKYSGPPITTTIYVDPARIADPLLTPSHNFTVNINISDAISLYSCTFRLGFNGTIIHATAAQLGSFFPPSITPIVVINNPTGYVEFTASLVPPDLPASGNGTLATIDFHVETQGNTTLHLYNVGIFDNTNQSLPVGETRDGYFNNALIAKLYVDPPEIIDPTLVPPKTFEIHIMLDDVENLYGYEFNMSYNKDVLTCLYIIINDALNETNYTPDTQISNSKGFVWARVLYYPPATPLTTYTPVALATICFRVKSLGATPLHLHDANLADPDGNPIAHETSDGFVMTVIRDVAVTSVTPNRDWAYAGWPVNIEVVAKNLGNVSETFNVSAFCNETLIQTVLVAGLPPNTESNFTITWDTTGVSAGMYQISANATTVPFEINLTNNVYRDGYVAIFTVKRDVAVTNVDPGTDFTYQGRTINITVTAENLGEITESFNVTAFYDGTPIGTIGVVNLTAATAANLTFSWNTALITPCHNYTISAEASLVPYEYNVTNNAFTDGTVKIRFVGDIDGDGKVDVRDVAIASAAFGSYPGHPRWDPRADITGPIYLVPDLRVDTRDVAMISKNFGKGC
ncbi:hypothetical protein MUP01_02020 [Candidatus Bathyarchaeota archaeon]|nr:hypothetical protein [Candidatus Bathyarchaeota archaeon]